MSLVSDKGSWFVYAPRASRPALRLFCLPYAGGSASFCSAWDQYLPAAVEVVAIQLPGREQRFMEPVCTDVSAVLDALVPELRGRLSIPFAVFGHSLGAAIAYELISELQRRRLAQPLIFFASGRQAPQFSERDVPIHSLPDAQFCEQFLQRRSSKDLQSLLSDEDARQVFLPQLRADYRLAENYRFDPRRAVRLTCPIVAMDCEADAGAIDPLELSGWREHTGGPFRMYRFPGDHFFIESARAQVLKVISAELSPFL